VRELLVRVKKEGGGGIVHQLRGKESNRCLPGSLRSKVLKLVKAKYGDFSPTLASEYLARDEAAEVSKETLRQWLIATGMWRGKRRRRALCQLRTFLTARSRGSPPAEVAGQHLGRRGTSSSPIPEYYSCLANVEGRATGQSKLPCPFLARVGCPIVVDSGVIEGNPPFVARVVISVHCIHKQARLVPQDLIPMPHARGYPQFPWT